MRLLVLVLLVSVALGAPFDGRTGKEKAKRLRANGGNAATEKAVARALVWLAKHQDEAGYWDADAPGLDGAGGGWHGERVPCPFDREVTALATLAFLGAGHTPGAGDHREVVARALAWLAHLPGRTTLFATAYATQALAEAYAMTGDEALKAPVEAGVALMLDARKPDGGWRYYPGMAMASGVPTTTAVVVALDTAERAGFRVDDAYKKPVLKWLDGLVDMKTGRVEYTVNGSAMGYTPTTTNAASALLIRACLGQGTEQPLVRKSVAALAKRKPKWSLRFRRMKVKGVEREVQIGYLQHYYWQQGTEALARLDAAPWGAWNAALKRALLPKQRDAGPQAGSWDPVGTYGKVGGRVFSTALCALALETYYRLP